MLPLPPGTLFLDSLAGDAQPPSLAMLQVLARPSQFYMPVRGGREGNS